MYELFHLSAPWWHFVLRACVIYVLVMVLVRVSGKRAVGQFTPFDLVLLILIGNAVQNGINGGDNSLTGAVIMATMLGMALGGWMSGFIFDQTGSYHAAFLNGIAWNLLNMSIVGWLFWRTRRGAGTGAGPQLRMG